MSECLLATPFKELPLREETQRLSGSVILSIALHVFVVAWILLCPLFDQEEYHMNSGTPETLLQAHLVTQQLTASKSAIGKVDALDNESDAKQKALITLPESHDPSATLTASNHKKTVAAQKNPTVIDRQGKDHVNASSGSPTPSVVEGITQTIQVSTQPQYRNPPRAPEYPLLAQRRKQEGVVIVNITVEKNGRTSDVSILQSSGFQLLDKAAVTAAKKWQLMPFALNGEMMRAIFQVPVTFELK